MSDYKRQHDIQEELLNYKALYEEKAKELEQFAYIVSHDLQGPLKNLLVFAQLLKADNENKLDAESLTLIKYMNDSVGHVMEQVQVLLKYSRLGNRNVIEDVDLNAIVEKVKQHFATEIADLQAQINCPNLPIISGLSSELYILFECLIHNALKFSKPSQKVVIDIDFVARGDFWEFDIRDNGLGVDPSQYQKIFLIFQGGHVEKRLKGSGAGLAYAKKIVELHGGKIWVESTLGQGSDFKFTLRR